MPPKNNKSNKGSQEEGIQPTGSFEKPPIDRTYFEKPKEIEELEKEVRERGRLLVGWISKLVTSKMEVPVSEEEASEKEVWNQKRIEKTKKDLNRRNDTLKALERVIDPQIREERTKKEVIEKYLQNIRDYTNQILANEKISDSYKVLVEEFTPERVNQLKWFELEKLDGILKKILADEPLTNKEAGLLRFYAQFPLEEAGEEGGGREEKRRRR